MLLANILLSLSSVIALLLGLFIIISNPRRPTNRAMAGLMLSVLLWLLTNLLTNLSADPAIALSFARLTLIGALLMPLCFLLFCKIYANQDVRLVSAIKLAALPLLIALTTPTSLNIINVSSYGQDTVIGPIYIILVPVILAYFGYGLWLLIKHYKSTKSITARAQMRYIFTGILLTLIPAILTNGVLPAMGSNGAYLYGPNTVIIFASFMTVAIVKHRLLDIRLIVARTLGYGLVLGSISGMYGLLIFTVSNALPTSGQQTIAQQVIYVIAAVFLAITFQPLKTFFDKLSNRFFYRDAYEPQEFLNELNRAILADVDLEPLLNKSAEIIAANLRNEFTIFGLRETAYSPQRLFGNVNKAFAQVDIDHIRQITPHIAHRVIVTDDMQEADPELYDILFRNNIAVIARLTPTIKYEVEGIGYLVLGPKKSGSPYSKRDVEVIRIIAAELVVAIQNALRFEEIEKFNVTLQEKVENATKKLQRSNEKLVALDETKDEFISMASHQLRTPLTSVKGYISMVLEGDAGELNDMQKKLLEQSFISSQRMVYLIADLLNLSRLRTGKFVIERAPTNLADVVEGEITQLMDTANGRNLKLTYKKPKVFTSIMLDETKIRQVIMNFTDNAIYYTPAGGKIEVALKETDKTIEFTVTDNGIGVPKSEQHHLFNKFYRAGNAKKARPDGTGLGLFMAKKVIIAQGGALIFHTQEGKGSTFGFSFAKDKLKVPEKLTPAK